jgi:membrane associated rhomboid family serine protease
METKQIKIALLPKILAGLLLVFYLLSHLNKNFNLIYANITLFTLGDLEIFRLITGIFISDNIVDLLFNIFILTIINYIENKEGTAKTTIRLVYYIITLQIIVHIIVLLVYILHPVILSNVIKPLPALGLSFLVRDILLTDNKQILVYKDVGFSNRLLLLFTFLLFIIINVNEFKIEAIVCVAFGFLICKFQVFANYPINEEKIVLFEKNDSYKSIFNLEGYIAVDQQLQNIHEETKDDIEIIDVDI